MSVATMDMTDELAEIVGRENVLSAPGELVTYENDGYTLERQTPDAVVLPACTEEVAAVMKVCAQHGVPIVPRGAGTSLAGGSIAVGGGVTIAVTRINRILEVDLRDRFAHVQAGCVNHTLMKRLAGTGLHYAPDPSSYGACTIGGNVATNSGGAHTLKYGVTSNHVAGVQFVLGDGTVVTSGGPVATTPGIDLTGLLVGSEGTFGICTEVWVKLTPEPQSFRTLLCVFDKADDASQAISDVIAAGTVPAALEFMDQLMIRAVEDAFHFGLPTTAEAVLILEVDGIDAGLDETAESMADICRRNGCADVRVAASAAERAALWQCRKKAFGAIGRLSPSYCTQDGVVPRTRIPEMIRRIRAIADRHCLRIPNVFHAGDGNVHPIILFDSRRPDEVAACLAASHEILDACIELGGTVTGEHGIGIEKVAFMDRLFPPASLECMRTIRDTLDPTGLCNPNKLLPGDQRFDLPALRRAT